MEELKPCPFCGGKAIFVTKTNHSDHYSVGFEFEIECKKCGLKFPDRYSINFNLTKDGKINILNDRSLEAVKKWNERIN